MNFHLFLSLLARSSIISGKISRISKSDIGAGSGGEPPDSASSAAMMESKSSGTSLRAEGWSLSDCFGFSDFREGICLWLFRSCAETAPGVCSEDWDMADGGGHAWVSLGEVAILEKGQGRKKDEWYLQVLRKVDQR